MTLKMPQLPSIDGSKRLTYLFISACLLLVGLTRLWTLWTIPPHNWISTGLSALVAGFGLWLMTALLSSQTTLAIIERTSLYGCVGLYLAIGVQMLLTNDQVLGSSGLGELTLVALSAATSLFLPPRQATPWVAAMLAGHLLTRWPMLILHPDTVQLLWQVIRDLIAGTGLLLIMLLGVHRTAWLEALGSARAMREMALTDDLTGLPNRRAAYRHFEEAMRGPQTPVSVLLLDIDDFKRVNDAHGHEVGDQVIQRVTAAMHAALGKSGVLVRWGGEEFLALLSGVTLGQAAALGEALRTAVSDLACPHGPLTISVGVSSRSSRDTVESLVHRADQGLYRAKKSGKNRVVIQES